MSKDNNGWGKSPVSKKWHYFVNHMSLCQKVGFYFGDTEKGNDDSQDNCSECRKKLNSHREE